MQAGVQVQVRMPKKLVSHLDERVREGQFSSRSDAVKSIIQWYEEHQKTLQFYQELERRSRKAEQHPERMIRLDDL